MNILIYIYIEMNPDANERDSMRLKQVPGLHWGINQDHPEEYQNPSSMSIKCCAALQLKEKGEKQGKTFEDNKLMSCLGNPQFGKQNRISRNLGHALLWVVLVFSPKSLSVKHAHFTYSIEAHTP